MQQKSLFFMFTFLNLLSDERVGHPPPPPDNKLLKQSFPFPDLVAYTLKLLHLNLPMPLLKLSQSLFSFH